VSVGSSERYQKRLGCNSSQLNGHLPVWVGSASLWLADDITTHATTNGVHLRSSTLLLSVSHMKPCRQCAWRTKATHVAVTRYSKTTTTDQSCGSLSPGSPDGVRHTRLAVAI